MTTNIERLDDLLFKIGTETGGGYAELIDVAADVVSEARRGTSPTIIRTVDELDALPDGTIMLDIGEVCWEKSRNGYWYFPGDYSPHNQGEITLPATILWTPEGA